MMNGRRRLSATVALLVTLLFSSATQLAQGFSPLINNRFSSDRSCSAIRQQSASVSLDDATAPAVKISSGKGFAKENSTDEQSNNSRKSSSSSSSTMLKEQQKAKSQLLDLLPRMTGQADEFRQVESLVNQLEESYQQVQTLDFLNLLQQGDWQLLFSTNFLAGTTPNPQKFRLRELYQTVDCNDLQGTVSTQTLWDLAEDGDGDFRATGSFTVKNTYEINQGARMMLTLQDHVLEPARGSEIPHNVPALVGLLHRAMPKELFDASEHAMDTTFLDADLKIVRYTGPRFEGTRDIFIRRGSWTIDPTSTSSRRQINSDKAAEK